MVCEGSCGVPLGERKFLLTYFVNIWAALILHLMCFSAVLLPRTGFSNGTPRTLPTKIRSKIWGFWVVGSHLETLKWEVTFPGFPKTRVFNLFEDARLWKERTQRLMAWCERSLKTVKIERKQESFHRGTISGVKPLANGDLWKGWKCIGSVIIKKGKMKTW